jgi:hypothetical protein
MKIWSAAEPAARFTAACGLLPRRKAQASLSTPKIYALFSGKVRCRMQGRITSSYAYCMKTQIESGRQTKNRIKEMMGKSNKTAAKRRNSGKTGELPAAPSAPWHSHCLYTSWKDVLRDRDEANDCFGK